MNCYIILRSCFYTEHGKLGETPCLKLEVEKPSRFGAYAHGLPRATLALQLTRPKAYVIRRVPSSVSTMFLFWLDREPMG